MRKELISTQNCYEGYDKKEECYCNDSYSNLYDNADIDNSTIEWSQDMWQDEKNYFFEMLQESINQYEKRYKTDIIGIALIGSVGLWNGNPSGGKIYDIKDIENILSMDVDDIEVVSEDGTITIFGHHHDGSHCMNIYFITENKLRKAGLFSEYEQCGIDSINYIEAIEKLSNTLTPVKEVKGYFGVSAA
jgi:hypothetical protein